MTYIPYPKDTSASFTIDGTYRTSERATLFDGKILNAENTAKWDTVGTGTATFSNNTINLAVTSGQYLIRQCKFFCPYFSGKPQQIESTSLNFQIASGTVKRIGYFSSSAVAPYNTEYDGVWVESDGVTDNNFKLVTSNKGTITHSVPWTSWDAYSEISTYDWSKFTVTAIDFLWLGGAGLRLFLVVDGKFKLVHTIKNHAGVSNTLIFRSPNHPVRYEIRSTTGSATLTAVCSQVSTEGARDEQGEGIAIQNLSKTTNSIATNYVIAAARKTAAFRDHSITLDYVSLGITGTTNDSGILMLCLNPTYSAPLTWEPISRIEYATPTTDITATSFGRVLRSWPIISTGVTNPAPLAALKTLAVGVANTMGELVIVYQPTTALQVVSGAMMFLEY